MPLRVLHVFRTYLPDTRGGVQEVIRQVCLSTAALGVENRVFVPSASPVPRELEGEGALTVRVKLNFEIQSCGFCLTGIQEFRRQVAWADLVHYHFPWPFQDVMHFIGGVKKPTLVTYHADIVRQRSLLLLYAPLLNCFLNSVDCIVATSDEYARSSPYLGPRMEKVKVIPLALDEKAYPVVSDVRLAEVRAQFGEGFFFFVGMLRYYKALHILVDAARQARDCRVVIAGAGPMEISLRAQAQDLGCQNVTFAGAIDDETRAALFSLSRGVVFPSFLRAEAFGVTLLEGAMYGKPLITAASDTGTSYVNRQGETGLVVPPSDPAALADAMSQLNGDPDLATRLGAGARARFDRLFTAGVMGARYLETYERLVEPA
ncbi:MAG: glycosyltransferase [Pseudomonadota bacterium]